MKVLVVAEFYPRASDPVLGIWAHRQALAARDAGAEVRVVVLHRPDRARGARCASPRRRRTRRWPSRRARELDGLEVRYVPFVSPPRGRSYAHWGAWAAPVARARAARAAARASRSTSSTRTTPSRPADAVLRARAARPLVISVHGGDVFHTAPAARRARARCSGAFGAARLVLANTRASSAPAAALGARRTRVVHLGTDLPPTAPPAAARRRSSPSATSSRASATPTCCARCGCCATAAPTCATGSSATARSAPRSRRSPRELGLTDRVELHRPAAARGGAAARPRRLASS